MTETKRVKRPRIDAVSNVLKAALIGQRIVRLLEPLGDYDRSLALQVMHDHFDAAKGDTDGTESA